MCTPEMQICVAEMQPATTIASLFSASSYTHFHFIGFHLLWRKKLDRLEGKSLPAALSLKRCKTSADFYRETSEISSQDVKQAAVRAARRGASVATAVTPCSAPGDTLCVCIAVRPRQR